MADQDTSSTEENSVMDYDEHERTFDMFMIGTKWLTIICVALLVAMAFGFFAGFGFFGGVLVFLIVLVASKLAI